MNAGFSLTRDERVALTFIAHNDPKDGFVRRTWLEFKTAICGLLQRTRSGGWIPVGERLPEIGVSVLCSSKEPPGEDLVWIGQREQYEWYFPGANEMGTPTHWMPLPEPPEVK